MHSLTGLQRDLLYVIAGSNEPHGLAIKDDLEEYYETEIHHGRLYPNLDTLVEKGLVEKGQRDRNELLRAHALGAAGARRTYRVGSSVRYRVTSRSHDRSSALAF